MHKEQKIIDADFIWKQRLVSGGRCPNCGEGSEFVVSLHSLWDLTCYKKDKKYFLNQRPVDFYIARVDCGICDEYIERNKIYDKIEIDFEFNSFRKEVRFDINE